MGRELGWGETRRDLEAETYLTTAGREYGVAPSPTSPESEPEPALAAPTVQGPITG
jgi:hypothetical protein